MNPQMSPKDKRAYEEWLEKCRYIKNATFVENNETDVDRKSRIARLKKDVPAFVKYYFPHYASADCGKFHIDAVNKILKDKNIFAVLEWAREHAKSVYADIIIPMFLMINDELRGMVLVGKNFDAACKLLGDLQAELLSNSRWIADFGEQAAYGSWSDGDFTIKSGINFIALGRGQSPRGVRNRERRPNYCVVDDIDDDEMVRNPKRVDDCADWILSALYGAFEIKAARFVMVGNRIAKKSVLATIVGDVNEGEPKREGIYHSKVFAIDPKTGQPAWKEKFTLEELNRKFKIMGYRLAQKEYFHNPITEGKVFKDAWIRWEKMLPLQKYDSLLVYVDPSFKSSNSNDFKAARLLGKIGTEIHHIRFFCRQCTVPEMVGWLYDLYEEVVLGKKAVYKDNPNSNGTGVTVEFWMEANFLQSILLDDFTIEGEQRKYQLPIRGDMRKKPDKGARIEAIAPLYERGFMVWNESLKKDPDLIASKEQLLAFEQGSSAHDDAPDAEEGGIFIIQQRTKSSKAKRTVGIRKQRGY